MRITFPARYCENFDLVTYESESKRMIEATFEKLNWKYTFTSNNKFQTRISLNFWSFGEKITVELQNEGILICSECVYPLQCFDWGKNKENVLTFLSYLEKTQENLLSNKTFQNAKSFDEKGLSHVERAFAESE